jgi:hypothetical protein
MRPPVTTLLVGGARGMRSSACGGAGPSHPIRRKLWQGLAPSYNQMIFESVARLNAIEPSKVAQSDSWNNPETKSSGTSTILRVFRSGGMACPPGAPSDCRRKATDSRLPPHLVSNVERRMEDQGLTGRTSRRPIAAGQRLAPATGPKNRLIGSRLPNSGLPQIFE